MFQLHLVAVTQLVALRNGHACNQRLASANVQQRRQTRPTVKRVIKSRGGIEAHIHQINRHYELMRNLARRGRWASSFEAQTYPSRCVYLLKHQGGIVSLALISLEPQIGSVAFSFRPFLNSYTKVIAIAVLWRYFKAWLSNKWASYTAQPWVQAHNSL